MLDSIFIGMSGLMGYSRGLRVIANNTANINTPGFKGAALQFGDLFYASGPASGAMAGAAVNQLGQGLTTYATSLDFSQGELRQSGNDLDLAVDGQGLFVLKDKDGDLRYSRDGEFKFDDEGFLVSRTTNAKVMAYDEHGALVEVSLKNLRTNPAKATSTVSMRGVLASHANASGTPDGTHTLTDVTVMDAVGAEHSLLVQFKQVATTQLNTVRWEVTVKDGTTEVGTGSIMFVGNQIDPASSKVTVSYQPSGQSAIPITLDFSQDVTSQVQGNDSTLAVTKTDGYAFGSLTQATFDADGVLNLKYSNGQTVKGVHLALSRFNSPDDVRSAGDNLFEPTDASTWESGTAQTGAFGAIRSGVVEISNVDLSSEFSDLVIMQRGYQASSQVVSTANEMIQELFSLKGR
jgi:flagellar hook protein FlgE